MLSGNDTAVATSPRINVVDIMVVSGEAVIMVVTLLGNSLVITAIHRFPKLKNTTNKLVYSLALSDIGVGVCLPFLIMFNLYSKLKTVKLACILRYQLIIAMGSISQFTLVLVSIDRFIYVQFPLHYHQLLSTKRVNVAIVIVWAYTFAFALLPIFGVNDWDFESWARCELENILRAPYVMVMAFHFFASSFIMILLYGRIFCLAKDHARRIKVAMDERSREADEGGSHGRKLKLSKATITLFLVLGVFILCWLPFYVLLTVYEVMRVQGTLRADLQKVLVYARMIVSVIGLANSMWNPIIYAGKNKDFRIAFKRLLGFNTTVVQQELLHLHRSSVPIISEYHGNGLN